MITTLVFFASTLGSIPNELKSYWFHSPPEHFSSADLISFDISPQLSTEPLHFRTIRRALGNGVVKTEIIQHCPNAEPANAILFAATAGGHVESHPCVVSATQLRRNNFGEILGVLHISADTLKFNRQYEFHSVGEYLMLNRKGESQVTDKHNTLRFKKST